MFDVGFSELVLIGIVALVVIGPEKLPSVARTLGHLLGRMQRYVNDVKADIQREMELDELKKLRQSVEDSARSIQQSVTEEVHKAQEQFTAIEGALDPRGAAQAMPDASAPPAVESAQSPSTSPASGAAQGAGSSAAPAKLS